MAVVAAAAPDGGGGGGYGVNCDLMEGFRAACLHATIFVVKNYEIIESLKVNRKWVKSLIFKEISVS